MVCPIRSVLSREKSGFVLTDLVDNEQISARDPRAPFPRHLVPTRHVDDVDDEIRELAAIVRCQVVASALDQEDVGVEGCVKRLQRVEVCGNVFAHCGVRAAASLDGNDTGGWQCGVAREELGVFSGCWSGIDWRVGVGIEIPWREKWLNEQTCLVNISFVTAAMLYSSRRARQSLSIRAVLPEPTGLHVGGQLTSLVYVFPGSLLLLVVSNSILSCSSVCL